MRFLTELRSCCSCTSVKTQLPEKIILDGSSITSTGGASSSMTSAFKRKTRMLRCKSAMHWQPGLSSISEDVLVPILEEGSSSTDFAVVSQKKSQSSSTKDKSIAKARSFSYGNYDYEEEYKRKKRGLFHVPAFSQLAASPYMF